jgi:hypothetical protein
MSPARATAAVVAATRAVQHQHQQTDRQAPLTHFISDLKGETWVEESQAAQGTREAGPRNDICRCRSVATAASNNFAEINIVAVTVATFSTSIGLLCSIRSTPAWLSDLVTLQLWMQQAAEMHGGVTTTSFNPRLEP